MRRAAVLVFAIVLAACGDEGAATSAEEGAREVPGAEAPVRRAAAPAAPSRTNAAAAVGRLAEEWRDPPEGRDRDAIVLELAALGAPGLEALILLAAEDPGSLRELVRDLADALGDDAVPVFAKVLRERTGTARWIAACELPREWPWLATGPDVANALLAALGDENVETRRQVLEQLGRAGPSGVAVAEAVVRRLDSDDPTEVRAARDALQELGLDAAVVFGLVARHARTFDGDPDDGAGLLSSIGPATEEDRRLLLTLLRSDDPARRGAALACFAEHPEASRGIAADVLPHLFGESGPWAGSWTIVALAEVPGVAQELLAAIPGLTADRAAAVVGVLAGSDLADVRAAARATALGLLRSASPALREAAVRCLVPPEGDPFDPAPLRPMLEDPFPEVRAAAALALCTRDPASRSRAVSVARAVLGESRDGGSRYDAAEALAPEIDAEEPPADWIALLGDDDDTVRSVAAERLSNGSRPLGAPPPGVLRALIDDSLRRDGCREAAAVAVRFEGGAEALLAQALTNLRSEDDDEALRALEALASVAPHVRGSMAAIESALGAARLSVYHGTNERLVRALAALSADPDVMARGLPDDPSVGARLLALGEAGALAFVRAAARWDAVTAERLAEDFGEAATLHRGIEAAARLAGDDENASRRGAARLARALGDGRAAILCAALAADPDDWVRAVAVETLARLASDGADVGAAVGALRAALADEESDVRRTACAAARHLPGLDAELRRRLGDDVPVVRLQAAAMILARVPSDADARRTLLDVLARAAEEQQLYQADWDVVGAALLAIPLDAAAAPILARALREVDECGAQREILRALPRLGEASAPALASVRLALADRLGCVWGWHDNPCRPDAIAALAAMGAAAAPALPDLRAVAATDREHAEAARAAIRAIESAAR